ncbi:MAG: metallopeptidase TldD-related protein [Erysipelotrichaceae bacterium]
MINFKELNTNAIEKGITALEVSTSTNETLTLSIFKQQVERNKISKTTRASLRGIYNGTQAICNTENINNIELNNSLKKIVENASLITSKDETIFLKELKEYKEVNNYHECIAKEDYNNIITLLKTIETKMLTLEKRIKQLSSCKYYYHYNERTLMNSYNLDLSNKSNYGLIYIDAIIEEDGDTQTYGDYIFIKDFKDVDVDKFVKDFIVNIALKLHPIGIASKSYPTILKNDVMNDLLANLGSIFFADNNQKGISPLANKLNTSIMSNLINISDDPFNVDAYESVSFDDEGYPCSLTNIVVDGKLNSYLYNLSTAAKDKVSSTGNGFKGSSAIGISSTNLILKPSTSSFDDLIANMNTGIVIEEIMGLHAGINKTTTDFSLQASGYYVENGVRKHPINLITIADNFLELMNKVTAIGNDLKFSLDGTASSSILFSNISLTSE